MASMQTVEIPYGADTARFEVPSENLIGVFAPRPVRTAPDMVSELQRALAQPIGAMPLRVVAQNADRVAIVADDGTRRTPVDIILPLLLAQLNAAGVPDRKIEVIVALGTHREMTPNEIEARFGRMITDRLSVVNHKPCEPDELVDLGPTPSGVQVSVNRHVAEADLVIGIGSIVPHHIAGFSGGAKIIEPGVCGAQTTGQVHLMSVRQESSLMGVVENPVRHEMEEIARRVGLAAILNTILDLNGDVVSAVYGDPVKAHRRGAKSSLRVYGVDVPERADIVIAGSHPCDSEFWQAHKTLYTAELCVRQGGTIIVVTPCPEGVTATHPDVLSFAARDKAAIDAAVQADEIADLTGAALALAWANTRQKATIEMVSAGISDGEARSLGFEPHASVDDALAAALARHGSDARVTVLPHAPDTLPLLG